MLNSDIIVGCSTLIVTGIAWWVTRDLSRLGGVFVDFTLWALAILSVLVLLKGFIKPEKIDFFASKTERKNVITGLLLLGAYLTVLPFIGFFPSSLLFFAVINLYLGDEKITRKSIFKSVVLSVVVVTVFYLVFKNVLEVPLPSGSLFSE